MNGFMNMILVKNTNEYYDYYLTGNKLWICTTRNFSNGVTDIGVQRAIADACHMKYRAVRTTQERNSHMNRKKKNIFNDQEN